MEAHLVMDGVARDFENDKDANEGNCGRHKEFPEWMLEPEYGQEMAGQRRKRLREQEAGQHAEQRKSRANRAATKAGQPGHSHAEQGKNPNHAPHTIPPRAKWHDKIRRCQNLVVVESALRADFEPEALTKLRHCAKWAMHKFGASAFIKNTADKATTL